MHKVNGQSLHEQFYYDRRNQLTDTYLNGTLASHIIYDNLGNITSKTATGGFEYQSGNSPYQLTSIVPDQNIDPGYKLSQIITYTDFNKVASITGNGYKLEIEYGLENQRISLSLSSINQSGQTTLLLNKHFIGGLQEKIFYETGTEKTISYITSPEGLTAIEVKSGTSSQWYTVLTDHLGSITTLVRESDGLKFELSYDAWGNRRNPATWTNYSGNLPDFIAITDSDFITDRGFTGHEQLDMFGLINMNGRVYDPVASRFLSPDSFIQTPELALNYNGYVYCLNNPLIYTDPTGEIFVIDDILIAAAIGAIINVGIQGVSGNINSAGDFFLAAGIGALAGAAGGFAGQAVAGALGTATSFGGAVANGALVGASGGFAGGFVGGAGNAWMGGASFGQGLQSGLIGGGYGALGGALIGGISGGIQYQRQISVFQKGCVDLGVNGGDPVPATDQFLSDAQKAWYKDAPMNNVKAFTVENVPDNIFVGDNANGVGCTVPLSGEFSGKLTGMSNVYFNKMLAFSSAKQLFFTMGHELVHVSQFAALSGAKALLVQNPDFKAMLDYHAYSYQNSLGGLKFSSYTKDQLIGWATTYPQFQAMNYIKFPWTSTHSFTYPF